MRAHALCVLALAACKGEHRTPEAPLPPPPALAPLVPDLRARAAMATPPESARLAQLVDLGLTAFRPDLVDARLAARSRAALLGEPDSLRALEQLLLHEHATVRSHAAFALGELASPASQFALVLRLKYERDPQVLVWIADALTRLGNGSGLLALADALSDAAVAQSAGTQAMDVLRRAGRTVAEQPTWADLQNGLRELHAHWRTHGLLPPATAPIDDVAFGARVAERLLLLTGFQLRPVDDTRFILARCGQAALPHLRRAIGASEPFLRTHALEVLRDLGPMAASAGAAVLSLLHDPLTRADAVRTLGAIGARDAIPFVRPLLAHADLELRTAAAGALGPLGDHAAEPALLALVRDAQAPMDVRVAAAFSLAVLAKDNPGVAFLRTRLEAGDYHAPTLRELLDRVEGK